MKATIAGNPKYQCFVGNTNDAAAAPTNSIYLFFLPTFFLVLFAKFTAGSETDRC